jgi:DNA repair exonuclease SbcCD ATPase subunit
MAENEHGKYEKYEDESEKPAGTRVTGWLGAAIALMGIFVLVAAVYAYKQQGTARALTSRNAEMSATVSTMEDQISTLTSKLNDLTAAQASAAQAATQAAAAPSATPSPAAKRQAAAQSKRMKQMQSQIDDEAKQLKDTQDSLAQARSDLEGNLNSTRDQLNGSIARTHEELVALEQRGERSYYEFDLTKSKSYQRTGPISVALRKADDKHRSYDLQLLVDDNRLTKRNVNLYEPIWLTDNESEQLQIVVNKIDKNHVHGYVSAPKYPQARVMTTSTPVAAAGAAPAAASAPSDNGAASQPSRQNQFQASPQ